ncbi:MAG: protein kinase [Symploca sp. SIO1B1]|nr:protein kinase [Symploca sp. SIO1B1]
MARPTLEKMVGGRIPVEIGTVAAVELLELLGVGGSGSAWKAEDCATGDLYVLKIIQGIDESQPWMAERARREAEIAIHSDYIVPVVGLCEWDPRTFLILFEYFPGKSLDKLLIAGSLTSEQKKEIFHQTLLGVSDAHRNNIIHRDLKPANILVGNDGRIKLLDFGVSKFKDWSLTGTRDILGTIQYMAPELIRDGAKVADARGDIYSLGQILYELAMGEHFWTRQGWKGLMDLVDYLKQTPMPREVTELRDFHCDFFTKASHILPGMVKVNPKERYASVDQVLSELGYIPYLPEIPQDLHLRYPMLIVESGSNRGARTLVNIEDDGSLAFGRAELAGADDSISRRHIEFSRSGDRYLVRELGSKNGTMARGVALKPSDPPMEIRHGDRIKVGDVFLRLAFLHQNS